MTGVLFNALALALPVIFGLLVLLVVCLIRKILHKEKMPLPKKLGVFALSSVALTAAAVTYVSFVYYRADDTALSSVVSSDTVTVTKQGDVYFFDGEGEDAALIFYPGALVQTEAYAPLLRSLAEEGVDVFLVDMPLRIAFLGVNKADEVMNTRSYDRWYLGGHSLGGSMASLYCAGSDSDIKGIIFLGSYPAADLDDDMSALSIYGSEDGVLTESAYESSRRYFTDNTTELVIEGGNHSQFGSYGSQDGDGTPGISSEEQKRITVEAMAEFMAKDADK